MLLLDIGNTRIKWATLGKAGPGAMQADVYADWSSDQLRERVFASTGRIERVLVANVGGGRIAELVRRTALDACGVEPVFLRSLSTQAGVHNAYKEPGQLGVDRWMSLIGARAIERRSVCVVAVGTAMTVDGLDGAGNHLGGVIVPGPDLMMASLKRNTSDIAARARAGQSGEDLFANNTQGGLYQGAVHGLAALVERAAATMQLRLSETPQLLLTGGASVRIEPALQLPFVVVPDLVLRGLTVVARQDV